MKKIFIKSFIFFFLALVVLGIGVFIYDKITYNPLKYYDTSWNIKLIGKCEKIYRKDTGQDIHGDGVFYQVYQCKNEVLLTEEFQEFNNNDDIKKIFYEDLNEINEDIDDQYLPKWNDQIYYLYKEDYIDHIIIFYDEDLKTYYVAENLY